MTVKWIRRIRVVDCKIIQIVLFVVRRSMEKKLCRFLCAAGGSGGTSSINLHQKEGVCSDDTSCNSSTQPQLVPSPASVFLTFQMCFFTRRLNRPDDPVDRSMHGQEQDSYSTLFISMYWCKCVECCSAQQCTCHPWMKRQGAAGKAPREVNVLPHRWGAIYLKPLVSNCNKQIQQLNIRHCGII